MGDDKEKKFISERILGREMTPARAIRWLLVSLACGLVFGGAAFGVFYIARSAAQKAEQKQLEQAAELLKKEAETAEETEPLTEAGTEAETKAKKEIETEKETVAEPTEPSEDGEAPSDTEEHTEEEETEEADIQDSLDPSLLHEALLAEQERYPFGTEQLSTVLGAQSEACAGISRYIVKVSNTISEVTWFESTVETRRNYSGIILSVDENEILVLTVLNAIKDDGSLSVRFSDGTGNDAVLRRASEKDRLAVIAVSTEGLGADFVEQLAAVEICPGEEIVPGMPVITAGSPVGAVNSFDFGNINYVAEPESVEDGRRISCYTGAASTPAMGTFLMSVDGRLLGLAAEKEQDDAVSGNRFLFAENCQSLLESLKKGYDLAWLGITGIDISFEMKHKNIPEGMYVTDVNEAGPAFKAGLKRGDIIVNIGAREIKGVSDYLNFMRNLRPDETVTVTIKRETVRSEYKELELIMTAGTR